MPTRREVLALAASSAVASCVRAPRVASGPPRMPARRGPRYFLSIYLSGGIDPITSADPKSRSEVEPWVDVPYEAGAIMAAGDLALGPHLAILAPHAARLTIVKGVALRTANHNTGAEQFLRMRTGTRPQMPTLLDLLGAHRDRQAVGNMDWLFSATQFTRLFDTARRTDLATVASVLRAEQRRLLARSDRSESRVTAASAGETADLFERVSMLAPPLIVHWSDKPEEQAVARLLQRVLWLFEHDLTRGFELNLGGLEQPWDTHTFNAERQGRASTQLSMVARFFAELERRTTSRGPLAAETLVLMGSEIGRFPALNTAQGKDHFPEAPFLLYGAGMGGGRGATFGRTGRNMAALPISTRTGQDTKAGGHTLALDDLGATLLYLGGVADPRVYGYDGEILEFLTAV